MENEQKENRIIISLSALQTFADFLVAYGVAKDHVECENIGRGLNSVFLSEDDFVIKDLTEFSGGLLEFKPNNLKQ